MSLAVTLAKMEDQFPAAYFVLYLGFMVWFVIAAMTTPAGDHASPKFYFPMCAGTVCTIMQGICLWAVATGYPVSAIANAACFIMPACAWGFFVSFGQANVLDGSSIGVYNWAMAVMTAVFSVMAVARTTDILIHPSAMRTYLQDKQADSQA